MALRKPLFRSVYLPSLTLRRLRPSSPFCIMSSTMVNGGIGSPSLRRRGSRSKNARIFFSICFAVLPATAMVNRIHHSRFARVMTSGMSAGLTADTALVAIGCDWLIFVHEADEGADAVVSSLDTLTQNFGEVRDSLWRLDFVLACVGLECLDAEDDANDGADKSRRDSQ